MKNKSNDLISVIIPTRNRYHLAKGAIDNVLKQTYKNFEIIIVEDGRGCGLEDYIKSLNNNSIYYKAHNHRKGLSAARNTGTVMSNGSYIAFLDDDERWINNKLELQYNVIKKYENRKYMVYCGSCKLMSQKIVSESIPNVKGRMFNYFFYGYCIGSSCIMISKKHLLSIGGHSENLVSCVDHDLWFKLSRAGFYMDYVPKGLVYSVEHSYDRMMNNAFERLIGIRQFLNKWKNEIMMYYGDEAWFRIEKIYHVQTSKMLLTMLKKNNISRHEFYSFLKRLFDIQEKNYIPLDMHLIRFEKVHLTPINESHKYISQVLSQKIKRIFSNCNLL